MYKLDLHTHSQASPDGGITARQYRAALSSGRLNYVAVTDHNRIDTAQRLQQELGEQIIVGEEIKTSDGEIIGLYLQQNVPAGLSARQTVQLIKDQGGLVYIPHPFETVRHGLHPAVIEELVDFINIMEIYNGRAWLQDRSRQAAVWSKLNKIAGVASSDAHGAAGLGHTFTEISEPPTKDNLVQLLAGATPIAHQPSLRAVLCPSYHRLRHRLTGNSH